MSSLEKCKKLLCKKDLSIGKDYEIIGFSIHRIDNRYLKKDNWYHIVSYSNENENKEYDTVTVLDERGNKALFFVYKNESIEDYRPREYSKFFYTPHQLRKKKVRQLIISK